MNYDTITTNCFYPLGCNNDVKVNVAITNEHNEFEPLFPVFCCDHESEKLNTPKITNIIDIDEFGTNRFEKNINNITKCTYTNTKYKYQWFAKCKTCLLYEPEYACIYCIKNCIKKNHEIVIHYGKFYCDEGYKKNMEKKIKKHKKTFEENIKNENYIKLSNDCINEYCDFSFEDETLEWNNNIDYIWLNGKCFYCNKNNL